MNRDLATTVDMESWKMRNTHVAFVAMFFLISSYDVRSKAGDEAQALLESTGVQGGLIVHMGCGDGQLAMALHAAGRHIQTTGANPRLLQLRDSR